MLSSFQLRAAGLAAFGLVAFAAGAAEAPRTSFDPSALDRAANPCQDFYQFACGGWVKANPIPADQSSWNRFSELVERNQTTLREILEQRAADDPKRGANERMIGDFYATCMDEGAVEQRGLQPLEAELKRLEALRSLDDLAAFVGELHRRGGTALFGFGSLEDFKDSRTVIAIADQGGLGLPERDYYFKDDDKSKGLRQAYLEHIGRMLELAGQPKPDAHKHARAVLDFETALAKGALGAVERRDLTKLYHKLGREELQALTPSFAWTRYLETIGAPAFSKLNVTVPEFFKGLDAQLKSTPLPTLKAYLRWRLLSDSAQWLSSPFANENFAFFGKQLTGAPEQRPRWKRCVDLTDASVGDALGKAFAERTFGDEGQRRMVKLVADLRTALQQDIHELPWMSAATKAEALKKLDAMALKVGVPEKWRDYSQLGVTRGDLLGNVARAQGFELARQLRKIDQPSDRKEFGMTVATVNAGYNPLQNDITFPAGILQPPFFYRLADDGLNYGAAGGVIGHEITHGFDDQGRKTDAAGSLRDWWSEEDAKQFAERAQCVVDQYSGYTAVDDVKLNGQLTLGENAADNGGLRLAYRALKLVEGGQKPAPIDGFSSDQRFFLGWAQIWCGDRRPEMKRMLAQVDPHSPGELRVNGVVANISEFQQAFSCKPGDAMVREKQCRVW